jgi:aryl-alcohol dehydrogenase
MKIRAAVSRAGSAPFVIEDVDLRDPRPDEILVRLVATGICHTDLTVKEMAGGAGAVVLGHEGAGVVEGVGPAVRGVRPGDHVVLTFASCGSCDPCRTGGPSYCDRFAPLNSGGVLGSGDDTLSGAGARIGGSFFGQSSFATHALTRSSNTVVVPRTLDLAMAAPLGCGVQTGAGAVFNVLRPDEASTLLILGLGGVGLAALMAARAIGVEKVVAVDPVASRREVARTLGASLVLAPSDDLVAIVHEHTGGGATHALDTTANTQVITQAFDALAKRGQLVLVGLGMGELPIDGRQLMSGGRIVRGCIEGDAVPHDLIGELASMHESGALPLEAIVRHYPFELINTAADDMRAGAAIKPVLLFG